MATTAVLGQGHSRSDSRARTRARLLAVGRRAFARKGLAGTNLKDDVLAPARVSVGSFYHQFRDKTDLFLAILEEHSRTFRAIVHAAHSPTRVAEPEAMARHSFETVLRMAEGNDDLFRIMAREHDSEDPRVRSYLRENRRRWLEGLADDYRRLGLAGVGGDEALVLAAELVSGMTLGAALAVLDVPARERPAARARLVDGLVRFTIGGLPALAQQKPASSPARRRRRAAASRKGA
ncbi:MAG TPA: TetR/AcrR family transcriptional regulator [Candidatus Binatia bacterium]|nr:TetR/AcrR family transcriptional regulator [Candidatus Binatia bacterium]